jgi:hypothetical protein
MVGIRFIVIPGLWGGKRGCVMRSAAKHSEVSRQAAIAFGTDVRFTSLDKYAMAI